MSKTSIFFKVNGRARPYVGSTLMEMSPTVSSKELTTITAVIYLKRCVVWNVDLIM